VVGMVGLIGVVGVVGVVGEAIPVAAALSRQ
jgi:hypothetical protein